MPQLKLILAAIFLASVLASGMCGYGLGVDHVRAEQAEEQRQFEVERRARQLTAEKWASDFEQQRRDSETVAHNLRKEIKNAKDRLAVCDGSNRAYLTGEFVRLYDRALQAANRDPAEPADSAPGTTAAGPDDVLDNAAENGQRWKQCRDQLSALIKVLKGEK